MKAAIFSFHNFEKSFLEEANKNLHHELTYIDARLDKNTAKLAAGFPAICAFVSDRMDRETLSLLAQGNTKFIALRSAGFNNVDLAAAHALGIKVARVPEYSPHSVAEHTVALILALNRKLYKAYNRVREANFSLEGLMGFDMNGKTVGVIGTGKIGALVVRILTGFGCKVLAYDVVQNPACVKLGAKYTPLSDLYSKSDIITLHCPLNAQTRHLISAPGIESMKPGVMLINTGRGALVDTKALINGLKSGKFGYVGLDVYEEEESLFFEDCSNRILTDDVFSRLLTFPNVLITGHQGFFTDTAVRNIAATTLQNLSDFEAGNPLLNQVLPTPK